MKKNIIIKIYFVILLVISNIPIVLLTINYIFRDIIIGNSLIIVLEIIAVILLIALFIIIQFMPLFIGGETAIRLRVLEGGKKLLSISFWLFIINICFTFLLIYKFDNLPFTNDGYMDTITLSLNLLFGITIVLITYANGFIRILVTSRRLPPEKRMMAILFMFIPIVQLGVAKSLSKKALEELDHELYKVNTDKIRIQSQICKTKYPLLMLHGVGFKDYKYINYWGRIPNELIKNGANIYYGHQEAWGTIESNAEEIRDKILEILKKEKCDKVNIIAHSKGGLDARYVVSQLGMGKHVATLTMIGTPHRGSEVLTFVYKLPKVIVKKVGDYINWHFRLIGDKNPDFHVASKQFLTEYTETFNKEILDHKQVYYQSYATQMKSAISDSLLFIPYCIIRLYGSKSDGLVTPKSAKWGEFKGTITNHHQRGISHGDIIDLKREDYKGFDVREFYVQLVSELKTYE